MAISNKTVVILVIVTAAVAFGTGRWLAPTKVETKTVERVVERRVVVTDVDRKEITKKVQKPDGTTETVTEIVDRSKIKEDTDKVSDSKTTTVTERDRTSLLVRGMIGANLSSWSSGPEYGIGVDRRVLGPVWLGAYGFSSGRAGVAVSISF